MIRTGSDTCTVPTAVRLSREHMPQEPSPTFAARRLVVLAFVEPELELGSERRKGVKLP